jgi:HPt (histidine-containing phosphotransfer) domain-containing protein
VLEALDKFEHQLRTDLVAIESELDHGNAAELARIGHRLRGSAALLCAEALSRQALALESAAVERRLDVAREGLAPLREQIQRCIDFVPTARRVAARAGPKRPGDSGTPEGTP